MVNSNLLIDGLVSVIIPMYNSELFIKSTIESVLAQTYQNFEIIIVDDCSKDKSCEIVNTFNDSRIILIRQSNNQGVAIARNIAIARAKGRYLAFLDSDDIWLPKKLEKQLKQMKNDVFFSYTAIGMINVNNNILKSHIHIPEVCDYKLLQKNTVIATSSVILDRSILGDIKMPNMKAGQDYATWMRLLSKNIVAYGIDEPLILYRKHKKSLSSNKLKSIQQIWKIQTMQQKIFFLKVIINILFFSLYAMRKHR